MKRAVLIAAAVVLSAVGVQAPLASAGPGQDAFLVVQSATIDTSTSSATHVLTKTTMCPEGSRATGGGAYPVTIASGTNDFRIFYSSPVDESGLVSSTADGDVPRGWQVSFNIYPKNADGAVRYFAICSANSDATIVMQTPTVNGGDTATVTVACPDGSRAVGGGMGKNNDNELASNYTSIFYETSPVDSTGTVSGTQSGDVATGWRTVATGSVAGNRFFAVCSSSADATIAAASFASPVAVPSVGSVACPAGSRALSGGLSLDTPPPDSLYRPALMAPVASLADRNGVTTGTVPRSILFAGKPSDSSAFTYRVFAVCTADAVAPVADTAPPDTTIGKGPKKKSTSTKAKVTFASEAGATFTCQLDKTPAKPCTSPYKVKRVKPGKHKLTVTAVDAAGNADPSPATYRWKVLKKKPKPHRSGCTGECRAVAGGYSTWVACSHRASAKPATECRQSQKKAAFFRSSKHAAVYKVCAKFPNHERLCASAQAAEKGRTRHVTLATADTGRHKVTWYVDGKKVGRWRFDVVAG
jgi:hypothetical protein